MKKKIVVFLICFVQLFAFAACNTARETLNPDVDDPGGEYEILYYMPIGDLNEGRDIKSRIVPALNEMLKTKLPDTTVNIVAFNWFEYTGKMSPVIASNSKYDLCFTSPTFNPYLTNVGMEAFYPLEELLPKYAPKTWAKFSQQLWNQTKVNGHIYAAINNQILPRTASIGVRDMAHFDEFAREKYNANIDSVYSFVTDPLDFIEEYLKWLGDKKYGLGANNLGITGFVDPSSVMQTWYGLDDLGTGMDVPGVVRINDDGNPVVINQFETEEFDDIIDTVIRWRAAGYIPSDASSRGNNMDMLDVNCASTWKPNDIRYVANATNQEGCTARIGDPNYYTAFVLGTMNAVSRTSGNPARVVKFIELLHTDKDVHNLLQYGVEGTDYTFAEENHTDPSDTITTRRIVTISGSGYSNKSMGWALGDEFLAYIQPTQSDDQHQQEQLINNSATQSAVIGFLFDPTPVQQDILACSAVYNTYFDMSTGAGLGRADKDGGDRAANLARAKEFKEKMKASGADRIIAEKQKQLDAWFAAQNA